MFQRLSTSFHKERSPPASPKSPSRSPLAFFYPNATGSKFTEDEVSAVLSSETGSVSEASSVHGSDQRPPWRQTRTPPSKLQKARKAPLPLVRLPQSETRSTDDVVRGPGPTPESSSGSISFCPTPHSAESFTEYHRLKVSSNEKATLVLLRAVAPEQSRLCSELLQTSLPRNTDAIRDIIPQKNGFVHTVIEAYNNHRGLIIRPDDVWLAILSQFSFFVNGNAEALRSVFVAHGGKQDLVVDSVGTRYSMDTAYMVHQMTRLMEAQIVDESLREWIMPSFTTTTPLDQTIFAMMMMGMMKEYFAYKFSLRCGIPKVTLEGERRDWEDLLRRLERLKKYGFQTIAWYHLLRPIISRFVASYDNPHSPKNLEFWNKIAHRESGSGPQWLSGWITAFCVFNEQGRWQGNKLNEERIREHEPKKLLRPADPLQLSASQFASVYTIRERTPYLALDGFPYPAVEIQDVPCGFTHMNVKLDDNGVLLDTMLVAGSIGSQICSTEKTELFRNGLRDTVRPVLAWWYLVRDKEPDPEMESDGDSDIDDIEILRPV